MRTTRPVFEIKGLTRHRRCVKPRINAGKSCFACLVTETIDPASTGSEKVVVC